MATIERQKNGYYLAKWFAQDGSRKSEMTTTREFERALKQGNNLEAKSKFWELADDGSWTFFAGLGFSPDYCHANFSHKAHLPLAEFKRLLREAAIEFQPSNKWRDRKMPREMSKRRYRFRGRMVTLEEALAMTASTMSVEALRLQMKGGKRLDEVLTGVKA